MVRPLRVGFNEFTAASNAFQERSSLPDEKIRQLALQEFDLLVTKLRVKGITVIEMDDLEDPHTPDAVFPNNWIAIMPGGQLYTFPLEAPVRRKERRMDIVRKLQDLFVISGHVDLSHFEEEGKFLEGTGSMVLDHVNRIAYACESSRTDHQIFQVFCNRVGYDPQFFHAYDRDGIEIYHTNVLMAVGDKLAVLCTEAVSEKDRQRILDKLESTVHEILDISFDQLESFAGNMIELSDQEGNAYLLMSSAAYNSLGEEQKSRIEAHMEIIHSDIPAIEKLGGGSVRCMVAGIHATAK
jgi:hypothetical protein